MRSHRCRRHERLLWFATLLLGACTAPAAPSPATAMLGEWNYSSAPVAYDRPSLVAGLLVTIVVESVDVMHFRGRVTRWFAGNAGVAPNVFGPVTGSMDGNDHVTVLISRTAPGEPTLAIVGVLSGDVLTVLESRSEAAPGPFPAGGRFERTR
jgi:hypothetical protein